MIYEELLTDADQEGVDVIYHNFNSDRIKGLYCDGTIALSDNIPTTAGRSCILAEELGHYHTSYGNIINQDFTSNRKQEYRARLWSYNKLIGLSGIVSAYKAGCRNTHEVAEHLEITEEFLTEALTCYRSKYGICTKLDNYVIYFEPAIGVFELI